MAGTANAPHEVLAHLEVVGFEEVRGVVARRDPNRPDHIEELFPTVNEVAILHVRFPGGPPFCVTMDGRTFEQVGMPLLSGILKKSEELRDSRSKLPAAKPADE
jgi:hypothetical protein